MIIFLSKEKQSPILEREIDALDIVTNNYRISIRKGGIKIEKIEQKVGEEKSFVPIYDEFLDLT